MKYIDAEKLKERIEKLDMESCIPDKWDGFYYAIDSVLEVITSLQQEQPEAFEISKFCQPIPENIANCVAEHYWEMLDDDEKEDARTTETTQKEQPEVDLKNNGWIDCRKQMPKETKQWSDTLQGHREWAESDLVLAWDSMYGCRVDATKNGKWMSEQGGVYTGQVVHGIIAWRPIPEFNEELLFNARKEE